ncbi:MAG: hypothetical protein LBF01_00720 [Bacteroidales bacterium]|jgi:hypothetical protein|nr:hypothetical protein [Bacteroidales bacterium]
MSKNLRFNDLHRKAFSKDGLSANFIGRADGGVQNKTIMGNLTKTFNFSVKNETTTAKRVAFGLSTFPDLETLKEKYGVNAVLSEGVMLTEGTGDAAKKLSCAVQSTIKLKHIQEFYKVSEIVIRDLELMSENKDNFLEEIEMCVPNPFEIVPMKSVGLRQWKDNKATDQNMLSATGINLLLHKTTLVVFTIKANSQIDFSATMEYADTSNAVSLKK